MTEATVSTERMEARLLRWGENNKGQTVTFQIHEDVHPFKGYPSGDKNGQRFQLVVAPIDDNEEPVPTEAAKRKKPFHGLSRAQQAGMLCKDENFKKWLIATYPEHYEACGRGFNATIRYMCTVGSRADLDEPGPDRIWDDLVARYREETQMAEQR